MDGEEVSDLKVASVGKNDIERAAELKTALRKILEEQVCPLLNNAMKDGIKIQFNIGVDSVGRNIVGAIDAIKFL